MVEAIATFGKTVPETGAAFSVDRQPIKAETRIRPISPLIEVT